MGWFDTDFGFRVPITVAAAKVPTNQTDFPVYFDLSNLSGDYWSNAEAAGGGLRIMASDGTTRLSMEIKNFVDSGATGSGQLYFKAPILDSSTDTKFYLYWGKSGATQPAAGAAYGSQDVWDSNFVLVWHHEEDPSGGAPQLLDSTSNSNNGTAGGAPSLVAGEPGSATSYDGDDDVVIVPTSAEFEFKTGDSFTLESWHETNPDTMNTAGGFTQALIAYDDNTAGSPHDRYFLIYSNTKKLKFQLGTLGGTDASVEAPSAETGSAWRHAAGVLDDSASKAYIYKNGVELANAVDGSAAWDVANDPISMYITGRNDVAKSINYIGTVSETRVSDIARSVEWLLATYNNLSDEGNFNTIGTYETVPIDLLSLIVI